LSQLANPSVQLREVRESDLPIFYEQQREPAANEMAAFPAREWEAFMAHWSKIKSDDSLTRKTILYKGQVAGHVLSFQSQGKLFVGYWLGMQYWGKGIASQALKLFLDIVVVRPLYAHVVEHNRASLRVLEKCGFIQCGETAGFTLADGDHFVELVMKLS